MTTKDEIIKSTRDYYQSVRDSLREFEHHTEERLNRTAPDGGWSAIQTMHHLILAEKLSLSYVKKKTQDPTAQFEKAGLKTWWRAFLIKSVMRRSTPRKAPAIINTENLPQYATLAETKEQWQANEENWITFFSQMPEEWTNRAIYKHPIAGRISWSGLLDFFSSHHQRHLSQIRRALALCIFICLGGMISAQDKPLSPCGTPPGISKWLNQYLSDPTEFAFNADTILYTRLQIHLLAKNDGTGRFRASQLLDALCRLNKDFAATKIQFFYDKPWNLINNTAWHDHDQLTTGIQMMLQNKVDSAINNYFVADPAGNCGYNLPYGGVANSHSCSGPNDHTWAHEIGHNLRLPHPFIGWEGKTYSYNTPTPLKVVYDYTHFHDTLDTGPTRDTALVEFVDRTKNCNIASDRLCLTPPDYLAQRWNCDASGRSTIKQKDPDGVDFYSDGTLFMSYANDACQNRFSDDEIAVMRANLLTEKRTYLNLNFPYQTITGTADATMPINGQQVSAQAVTMRWKPVTGATHYVVQGNRITASFPVIEFEFVTTDTNITVQNLVQNKTYYYRIKPFNSGYWCTTWSPVATFFTLPPVAVQEIDLTKWFAYPSVVQKGTDIRVHMPDGAHFRGRLDVFDTQGRLIASRHHQELVSEQALDLDTTAWPSGMYLVRMTDTQGMSHTLKFVCL